MVDMRYRRAERRGRRNSVRQHGLIDNFADVGPSLPRSSLDAHAYKTPPLDLLCAAIPFHDDSSSFLFSFLCTDRNVGQFVPLLALSLRRTA